MSRVSRVIASQIDTLPRISPLGPKLFQVDINHPNARRDLVRIAEMSPELYAKLIGLANSVFYGMPGVTLNTAADAVDRLGLLVTKDVALTSLFAEVQPADGNIYTRKKKWLHFMSVAFACREIAKEAGVPLSPSLAYLAGLTHDLGVLVMDFFDPWLVDDVFLAIHGEHLTLAEAEEQIAGVSHTELGATLGRNWNLPTEVVHAITYHHNVEQAVTNPLTATVLIAEQLMDDETIQPALMDEPVLSAVFEDIRIPGVTACMEAIQLSEKAKARLIPRLQAQLAWYDQVANTFHCI